MGRRPIDQPRGGQWPGGRGGTSRAQGHTCGGGGVPGSPSWSWPPYCPRPPRKGQLPCRANQPPSTQQGCLLGRGQGLSGTLPLCSVLGSAVPAPPPAVNHAQWGNRGPLLGPPNTRRGGRVSLGRSQPSRKPAPTTLTGVLSSGHLRTWPSPADCTLPPSLLPAAFVASWDRIPQPPVCTPSPAAQTTFGLSEGVPQGML